MQSNAPNPQSIFTISDRAASPTAIAITRSSCSPRAAPVLPRSPATNVRHSDSSLRLRSRSGALSMTDPSTATISGFDAAVVNHPVSPFCAYIRAYRSTVSTYAITAAPWLFRSIANRAPLYSLASSTEIRASSCGRSRCCSSAHCRPVARSITCTAAKSPSDPPPAASTPIT
jgi:hypothetical protein